MNTELNEQKQVSIEQVEDLLNTILNFQHEIHQGGLRMNIVEVDDIKTSFREYFDIK